MEHTLERILSFTRGKKETNIDCFKQLIDWWLTLGIKGFKIKLPLVFTTEEGYIDFEWRSEKQYLSLIHIVDNRWEYYKESDNKIEEGVLNTREEILELLESSLENLNGK